MVIMIVVLKRTLQLYFCQSNQCFHVWLMKVLDTFSIEWFLCFLNNYASRTDFEGNIKTNRLADIDKAIEEIKETILLLLQSFIITLIKVILCSYILLIELKKTIC